MNILFLYGNAILPTKGGIQRKTAVLAAEFTRRGHTVFYLSLPQKFPAGAAFLPNQFFLPDAAWQTHANIGFFRNFLRERGIDIVINQGGLGYETSRFSYHANAVAVPVISAACNSLLDVPRHFYETHELKWRKKGLGALLALTKTRLARRILLALYKAKYRTHFREVCKNSARLVLLSESFLPDLAEYFPGKKAPANACAISNPAMFPRQECAAEKEKILLFVGRLENGQKRVDFLLKIWAKLEKAFPQWRLEIVGDGPSRGELEVLAGTLGLQRVTFEGFQKPEKYYRRAPIFCMTSTFEGFGNVLTEAASYGCVPVAFDSYSAVRDIISDGENGALVPPFDLDKYAGTLAALMRDDALRERLSANTAQICEKFAPAKIVDRWEALFAEVLAEKKKISK